jgi:phenylalanyl-tRNA synthetase beta chain
MKFRLEWLASYLPGPAPDAVRLREALTAVGLIVEGVEGEGPRTVFDVEITSNRPDAMNHRGLAREAAVALRRSFADPGAHHAPEQTGGPIESLARVVIEDVSLCPRYSARVIEGFHVGPSSAGVAARLAAIGSSRISAPVDATNHVLWDIGQPLHAFDLDKLAKGTDGRPTIVVRRARGGEKLVTLDGVERMLSPEHLVIADAEKAVALAGVMGGLETAISEKTTRTLLESAYFDPGAVRRSARSLGMHTDASHRFERGTDPNETVEGLDRATRLIVAACGGRPARGVIDEGRVAATPRTLALRIPRLRAVLGMEVPLPLCERLLSELGFQPTLEGSEIHVVVPSWRVDIAREEDLIEEVVRCAGYDQLPETLPRAFVPTLSSPRASLEDRVRDILAGAGLDEAQTYSFVSAAENAPFESVAGGAPVRIENALGEPFTTMRATLVIGLLRSAQHNTRRGLTDLRLFEVGRSYAWNPAANGEKPEMPENPDERITERSKVGILLSGRRRRHWSENPEQTDFFEGSGIVAALMRGLGMSPAAFTFEEWSPPFLASGRGARVVAADGRAIGWVGVLSPDLSGSWDLVDPVVGEMDLDLLAAKLPPPVTSVEAPSRLPGSEVDLTVTHRWRELPWKILEAAVRKDAPAELLAVEAKGVYRGTGVPDGFVKTTLTLRFGSPVRSLSREEVNGWRDAAARRVLRLAETKVDGVPPRLEEGVDT